MQQLAENAVPMDRQRAIVEFATKIGGVLEETAPGLIAYLSRDSSPQAQAQIRQLWFPGSDSGPSRWEQHLVTDATRRDPNLRRAATLLRRLIARNRSLPRGI
jgi:hypothetical protein